MPELNEILKIVYFFVGIYNKSIFYLFLITMMKRDGQKIPTRVFVLFDLISSRIKIKL